MQPQYSTALAGLALASACGAALFHFRHTRKSLILQPEPVFDLQCYLQKFYSEKRSFALAEQNGTMAVNLQITPGADTEFLGKIARTCEVALTLSHANSPIAAHATTFYLEPVTGQLLGCRADNCRGVFTRGGALPNDAVIGSAGEFFAADMFAAADKSDFAEIDPHFQIISRYELIENPALPHGRALLRVDTRYEDLDAPLPPKFAQTILYGIDTSGAVDIRRTVLYLPGKTLSFGAC